MDQVTQIKQTLNIVDVVGKYLDLKKSGKNYKTECPFHGEKTPSFMVSSELQIYKCFGCGESGDIFTFVQKMEGVEFAQALEQLADQAGIKLEKAIPDPNSKIKSLILQINADTTEFYRKLLFHDAGKVGLDYLLNKRKLSRETIDKFKIGYALDNWDFTYRFLTEKKKYDPADLEKAGIIIKKSNSAGYIDKFRHRIIFPLIDASEKPVGFIGRTLRLGDTKEPKYLNSPDTPVFDKSNFMYGLNLAKTHIKQDGAIFVEGQLDVISANQAGIENVVATTGTSLTNGHLKILSRYTKDIIFCFDNDGAGQSATLRAIELAEKMDFNVKTAVIPTDVKDLDELIHKDRAKAKNVLGNPVSVYDYYVSTAFKRYDQKTPYGKKKIVEELAPKLSLISNPVVKDHYVQKLSEDLQTEKEIISEMIRTRGTSAPSNSEAEETNNAMNTPRELQEQASSALAGAEKDEKLELQMYLMALVLQAELETAQNLLYKLGKKDFTNEYLQEIFVTLKQYAKNRKRALDPSTFVKRLEEQVRPMGEQIALTDIGALAEEKKTLEDELEAVFKRIKRDTISRELSRLKEELKQAELSNDSDEIETLSEQVYKFSKLKKKYE